MKVLVFLQNAWSPVYAGRRWPRQSWLHALKHSRSGQRLRELEGGYPYLGCEWYYENATPEVSAKPDGFIQADLHHMVKTMHAQKPDVVIALGKEPGRGAMIACATHPLTILAPHPANRVLTNDLYRRIGKDLGLLSCGFKSFASLVTYQQKRGRIEITPKGWLGSTEYK